jgi:hypothetical protein
MSDVYVPGYRPEPWTRRQAGLWFATCAASTLLLGLLLNWTFAKPDPLPSPRGAVLPSGANDGMMWKVPPDAFFGLAPVGGMPAPVTPPSPQPTAVATAD